MLFTGLAKFIQVLINVIGVAVQLLLSFFPPSPFSITVPAEYSTLISNINYFVPLSEIAVITETWLVAVGLYYAYSIYARFVKAIE